MVEQAVYVLVDNTTTVAPGAAPGADIDTISLIKADGSEYFATAVVDHNVDCTDNSSYDLNALLGPNDATDRVLLGSGGDGTNRVPVEGL